MKVEEYREAKIELLKGLLIAYEIIAKALVRMADKQDIKQEIFTIKEIEKKEPVKKPDAPKIEMGKVYNYKKKDGTPYTCRECGGLISWDDRPQRIYPMHVDEEGHIVGDGDCPMFPGGDQ